MPRHRVTVVPHAAQGSEHPTVRHRPLAGSRTRKHVLAMPRQGLQLAKDRDSLPRQRHQVPAHQILVGLGPLHALARHFPQRRIKVELAPLCLAQLSGAQEHERREPKRSAYHRLALVRIDGPQQLGDLGRVDDRCVAARYRWPQRAGAEELGRIALRATRLDAVLEDLAAGPLRAMSRLDRTALLDLAQHGEHLLRRDVVDGPRAEPWEHVLLEPPEDPAGVRSDPRALLAFEPFATNAFEGCLRSEARDELGLLALAHRIQALVEHGSRFLVLLTRGLQAHAGVRTICNGLLAPRKAVVPAPVARPIGVHEQHEAAAVAQLVRLLAWLRLLALHVGESFESAHLMVSGRRGTARDARYHQKYQQK